MRADTQGLEQLEQAAAQGASLAALEAVTGKSAAAVLAALLRWLRRSGQTDVTPWVVPADVAAITAALAQPQPPSLTQLAATLQVPLGALRLVAAARWNASHPVPPLPPVPRDEAGQVLLPALLAARWSLPLLVRATGLHPATLEARIAAYLAAQPEPDAAPWLADDEVAAIAALLDGPSPWHALRRAMARGETTRGKVAIVLALRGQWRPPPTGKQPPRSVNHGKAWSRAADIVVRAGHDNGTPLAALAQTLGRSSEAVLARAQHLGVLAPTAVWGISG